MNTRPYLYKIIFYSRKCCRYKINYFNFIWIHFQAQGEKNSASNLFLK